MEQASALPKVAIDIEHLSKRYHGSASLALDDLTLRVNHGEVYGFLGPNGAGKSTTIRLLLNFIAPSNGSSRILGHDVVTGSLLVRQKLGYLAGDAALYPTMTGRQYLHYLGALRDGNYRQKISELADRLDADLDKKLGDLSRGNRQKISIIQAFMHQPLVYVLDEPTSGLDPLMQEVFYELVNQARQEGAAVFMSSHILSEVQKICDRVGIIKGGRLVREQSVKDLADGAIQTFDIKFGGPIPITELHHLSGLKIIKHDGNHVTVTIKGPLVPLLKTLSHHDVHSLHTPNHELESEFLDLYESKGTTQ